MSLRQSTGHIRTSESTLTQGRDSPRFETQGQTPNQGEDDGRRNEFTASSGNVSPRAREPTTTAATNENWMKEITTTMRFNQRPVPSFNEGTCIDYWTFRDNFKKHVREDSISDLQMVELLVLAYSGSAKQELYACNQYPDPAAGYEQAWLVLNERYGDRRKYFQNLVRKVIDGQRGA